ncbi:MAG: hypothetical protein GX046_05990 [Tissierellia bacterium]|nr:hypothetical protein [Tissierellia bacterium]
MHTLIISAAHQEQEELMRTLEEFRQNLDADVSFGTLEDLIRQDLSLVFVATGGTEEQFLRILDKLPGKIYLLTHPAHNSLAASLEILAYLQEKGRRGEILHGTPEFFGDKLKEIQRLKTAQMKLQGMRLGVFGISDWLIASEVDEERVKEVAGISFIPLPIEELLTEVNKGGYEENIWTAKLVDLDYDGLEMEKSLEIYGALKRLMQKHGLTGFSLRCFDLLGPLQSTACLALAILNAEGYPAGCEGDKKSLLSMVVAQALLDESVFMANPSSLDPQKEELVIAHCTLPLDYPKTIALNTHFESGIGVAVASEFDFEDVTLFKMDSFRNFVAKEGKLLESLYRNDLCRSQMRIHLPGGMDYFLKYPIANHHMVLRGHHAALLKRFLEDIAPGIEMRE